MRKLAVLIILLLSMACRVSAQDFVQAFNFASAGIGGPGIGKNFTSPPTGVNFFFMSWSPGGPLNSCSVRLDSSTDGITWGSGDVIASQSCSSVGSASASFTKTFVRVNVTAMNGAGGLNVTLQGYVSNGGGTAFAGIPSGTCTSVQTAVNTLTGDFYTCISGVWIKVGPGGNPGVLVSPVITPNPLNFDGTLGFKGPFPYTDVSRYGARTLTVNSNIPGVPGITANITSGTASATVSTASCGSQSDGCFVNGTYAVIFGAGAANGMSTPGAPTVTPSVAAAGTGTSLVVNTLAGGATTYNYQIVARNKAGGITAASTVGTTAIGSAALGPQSVTISGWTRTGAIVTATTSSAHTLSPGSMVYMFSTPQVAIDNGNFGGWFVVSTVPDNTHFTYLTGLDTAYGAPTASIAGGTANWFNCNHLTWTAVAGAYEYYIYGRTGGSLTLLGVSKVQSVVNGMTLDLTWDDFGSPMMDGITLPYFVPTTPPVVALANPLTAKVTAGGGTTTLTLDTNATTTVTRATILIDNAPAIVAAAVTAAQGTGLLQISDTYIVNSYCVIPNFASINVAGGSLILNDTFEIGNYTKIYGNLGVQRYSVLSFGWNIGGYFTAARANPGIYGLGSIGTIMQSIEIDISANAGIGMVLDNAANSSFKFINVSVAGPMGIGIISRATAFLQDWDHIAIISPQGVLGSSATPAFYITPFSGDNVFSNISLSGRGFFEGIPTTVAARDTTFSGNNREQGGITPFWMDYIGGIGQGGQLTFGGVELDTMAQAFFANLSSLSQAYSVNFTTNVGQPSSGFSSLTGSPVASSTGVPLPSGQNYSTINGSSFTNSAVQVSGTGVVGYALLAPSAAPSAVVSAGGSVPIGTSSYVVSFLDVIGKETPQSIFTNFTTTLGNQTVTVTPPVQTAGAVSWKPYRCGVNADGCALANIPGCGSLAFGSTFVDTFGFLCGASQGPTGAFSSSLSSSGLAGIKVLLVPTLFANLGTPVNGSVVYCSDCTIANPCAGGGTGAMAKRLNAVWVCN